MKKVAKAILFVPAFVILIAVLAMVGINLYIQSPRTQARIQEELSKALRMPLRITNTSVTPWGALRVHGITIPGEGGQFLEAESFHAHCRLLPLFRGRIEIPEMSVADPKVHWMQDAEGKWVVPSLPKPPKVEKEAPRPVEKPRRELEIVIEHFLIKNGSADLLDHQGKVLASLDGVSADSNVLAAGHIEGTVKIARAAWTGAPALEKLRAPFTWVSGDAGEFALPSITAALAGGAIKGEFRKWPKADKSPFEAALTFEGVDMDQLAMQEGWRPGQAAGRLEGNLTLAGESARPERAEGAGVLRLRGGQLRELDLLQAIGQVLAIRELSDFHLQDAHADFHISGEKVHVDQLILAAPDLQVSAKGTIRFDQKVSLDSQLSVEDALVKQLPSMVSSGFATAENGRRTIDFKISGTTSKLKANLMEKLIVSKIDAQFGGLLESLFKNKDDDKKKADDKKKKDQEKEKRKKEKQAVSNSTPAPAAPPALEKAAPAPAPDSSPTAPLPEGAPAAGAAPKP